VVSVCGEPPFENRRGDGGKSCWNGLERGEGGGGGKGPGFSEGKRSNLGKTNNTNRGE